MWFTIYKRKPSIIGLLLSGSHIWTLSESRFPQISYLQILITSSFWESILPQVFSCLQDSTEYSRQFLTMRWYAWSRFFLWFHIPPISNSSRFLLKPFKTFSNTLTITGIIVTRIFLFIFFRPQARSNYLSNLSLYLIFALLSTGSAKSIKC